MLFIIFIQNTIGEDSMKITSATYSIICPQNKNIRRDIFNLEGKLEQLFATPFSLIPIPDDAPPEIPRIHASSKGGHSTLDISFNTIQITVNFDEAYWGDSIKCLCYLNDRVKQVAEAIGTTKFLFSGLSLNIELDEIKEDPVKMLSSNFCNVHTNIQPYDVNTKITYVIDEKYYINIQTSNLRKYVGVASQEVVSLSQMSQSEHIINVLLDINDRFAFNYTQGYTSGIEEMDNILALGNKFLNTILIDFITKGEMHYEK